MKLRIHLRNKYAAQMAGWRQEQGAKADGELRSITELVRGGRAGCADAVECDGPLQCRGDAVRRRHAEGT